MEISRLDYLKCYLRFLLFDLILIGVITTLAYFTFMDTLPKALLFGTFVVGTYSIVQRIKERAEEQVLYEALEDVFESIDEDD